MSFRRYEILLPTRYNDGTPVEPEEFAALEGVRVTGVEGATIRLSAPEAAMDALLKALARHRVVDLVSQPADLEEIFLGLYREADDGS